MTAASATHPDNRNGHVLPEGECFFLALDIMVTIVGLHC